MTRAVHLREKERLEAMFYVERAGVSQEVQAELPTRLLDHGRHVLLHWLRLQLDAAWRAPPLVVWTRSR